MRFKQGKVSSTDVLQQRQTLEATKESKIKVESSVQVLEHQLAVLMGKAPKTIKVPDGTKLPNLPLLPATGLPSELIKRRPDIISSFLDIKAADKRIAAAVANKYPRISISANISTSDSTDTGATTIFNNWLATLAGNLVMPLLDAGSREAEVNRTRAVQSETINRYGKVILNALKEVEDALSQESLQLERLDSLNKQFELSEKSATLIRERYTLGATDFLRFISALQGHHSLERNRLTAQRELIEYRINLYRALGGSWDMERAPPYSEPRHKRAVIKQQKKDDAQNRGDSDVRE